MEKSTGYALAAVGIWSTLACAAKLMMNDLPSQQTLCIGSAIAAVFLFLINIISGKVRLMCTYSWKSYGKMAGLGILGLYLYNTFYYYGIDRLSSQEACILNYLWPVMIMIFSTILLKEKMTIQKVIAMCCSFVGTVILTLGNGEIQMGSQMTGILACIGAAVSYGLFSVLNKKEDMNQSITMMISWTVTAVLSFFSGMATEKWVGIGSLRWPGLLWLGIMTSASAYLFWAIAMKETRNTARTANLAYLTPFLSILISAVVLKERIRATAIIALVFIIGGILIQAKTSSEAVSDD